MDVNGFLGVLYFRTGFYADENIAPYSAFGMSANRAKIVVRAVLICLNNDLFGLQCTVFGAGR